MITLFTDIPPGLEEFEMLMARLDRERLGFDERWRLVNEARAMLTECAEHIEGTGRLEEIRLEELARGADARGEQPRDERERTARRPPSDEASESLDPGFNTAESRLQPAVAITQSRPRPDRRKPRHFSALAFRAHLCVTWGCLHASGLPAGAEHVCAAARPKELKKAVGLMPAACRRPYEEYLGALAQSADGSIERSCAALEELVEDRDVEEWLRRGAESGRDVFAELADAVADVVAAAGE